MKGFLILEDGTVFEGTSIGVARDVVSEIVFQTGMSGYMEVLTDRAYKGQTVVMTYPLIGNSGVPAEMQEKPAGPEACIVKELSRMHSNFRSKGSVEEYLKAQNMTGLSGVDTRALTRLLREKGTMKGFLTTNSDFSMEEVLRTLKSYEIDDTMSDRTCEKPILLEGRGKKIALLDFGAAQGTIQSLQKREFQVMVFPPNTSAEEILASNPDGIVLPNGPGNPNAYLNIVEEIKTLFQSNLPILAVGLGHQLLALAKGGKVYKLKHGHRGGNHPVKEIETGRVYLSAQNHGYAVDASSLHSGIAKESFYNVNDKSNEGLEYIGKSIVSVQFYLDTLSGPQDVDFLLDKFVESVKGGSVCQK